MTEYLANEEVKREQSREFAAKAIELHKDSCKERALTNNRSDKKGLLKIIERIERQDNSEDIKLETLQMKDQIIQLSDKIDQDINEVAIKVKDFKSGQGLLIKDEFDKITKCGKDEWKKLKAEIGTRLQAIEDQITNP